MHPCNFSQSKKRKEKQDKKGHLALESPQDSSPSHSCSCPSMQKAIDKKVLQEDFDVNDELLSDKPSLNFHDQEYIGKIKELQYYLDMVKQIVKPGCSQEVLNVALTSMSSLVKTLSTMTSGPYALASL